MAAGAACRLDTDRPDRKLWLVRVPPQVAARWEAACTRGTGMADLDDDDEAGKPIGRVTMRRNAQGQEEVLMEVADASDDMPAQYCMRSGTNVLPTSVLSMEQQQAADSSTMSKPKVEGVVDRKYDLVPMPSSGKAAAADPSYRALSRKRNLESQTKGRIVQTIDDRQARLLSTNNAEPLYSKQRQGAVPKEVVRQDNKRVRMDKDPLEQMLFSLFERQAHWNFVQLQRETNQPAGWLKEVLSEVAILNKRGPNKELWELKKEYRGIAAPTQGA